MNGFAKGERRWVEQLDSLRNAVRQEVIAAQLGAHVRDGSRVLDVGCGQGTQAIRLARRGCSVVGVDPSTELLGRLASDAREEGVVVDTLVGSIEDLTRVLDDRRFDVVCAHGLLMYLDDPDAALAVLAERLAPGGLLSVTFRNGAALAFRPGMRHLWREALDAFEATTYVNGLGVSARADRLEDVTSTLTRLGLGIQAWYGVRVFTDPIASSDRVDEEEFASLLRAEIEAGRRDPYRQLASQIHLIAQAR